MIEGPLVGYAICTLGRSGSNWLGQMLSSTDALGYPLEYFNGPTRRVLDDPSYPDDPIEQIRRILTMGCSPNGVYGVKLFPSHLQQLSYHASWSRSLPNLRFVHLERRDTLAQALSLFRASQTGLYRATELGDVPPPEYDGPTIRDFLVMFARDNARWKLFFARNGVVPVHVTYEEALEDPQAVCNRIARHVGLAAAPPINWARVTLKVQRDERNEEWRSRFIREYGNLDLMDEL